MITRVVSTSYGQMILPCNDINQTGSLQRTGKAIDHNEIMWLKSRVLPHLGSDPVFADIGANVGTYTIAMARDFKKVYAVEAQPLLSYMVSGTMVLNQLQNVRVLNVAMGDKQGFIEVPQFDYEKQMNFGSVEFGPTQKEQLTQERGHDLGKIEHVPLMRLDDMDLPKLDLLKIDVEGMEMAVLRGGRATIAKFQPVMYIEFIKVDPHELHGLMQDWGYTTASNGINVLCIPERLKGQITLD